MPYTINMPDDMPQQNTNPSEPEFKPLEDIMKETRQEKATAKETTAPEPEEKPHLLFERNKVDIRPILETKKPTLKTSTQEKPKKKTPKARIELPE